MPVVISAINGKGGAGKTTALMNIAGEYALRGSAVAMVDMDGRSNLTKWWSECHDKNAQPEGISVFSHKTAKSLDAFVERHGHRFDYLLIDTPGEDISTIDPVIGWSDLVISPVQPSKREVLGAIDCFHSVLRINEARASACRHGVLRTRISMTVRQTELYRKIRPIIEDKVGTYLFRTEVMERNVYKDIQNGIGTLQMQTLSEAVAKARRETQEIVSEIDALLSSGAEAGPA
ncbi:ParA family protein [Mesorhizobium sp. CO1-1-7]|uniref:ParA family protein n=1 Tax=unclassified Mesorhizobium TaxID=325217 RepID=UPI00112A0336|nr:MULTISPECIES: ParA family protein [unclassified Mesorhizobium]MBZ9931804.1 ParA family protein [Mesorhizobium sp. BR1-1-5]MBZ9747678.1 ParA family protein [Mesorhizobium sp. CO1-1-7]MBZ9905611.1 ParA family protein [Mesorhizobium sp. BR115XR7A]TPK73863.1 ParA family protein [Mesorhizobium sp. B2-4-18]TPL74117.1 ParA family protein [Mesorhizobium sp. B2-3-15]